MTREIKFRGKSSRKDVDMWLYGDLIKIGNSYHILGKDDMREDGHHITQDSDIPTWIDKDTIGQFIGLFDKNGKEIYEGDIIKVVYVHDGDEECWNQPCGPAIPQEVKWDEELLKWSFGGCRRILWAPKDFEVIGNIHDNPELLKTE